VSIKIPQKAFVIKPFAFINSNILNSLSFKIGAGNNSGIIGSPRL
jgi:hypothetical protein